MQKGSLHAAPILAPVFSPDMLSVAVAAVYRQPHHRMYVATWPRPHG